MRRRLRALSALGVGLRAPVRAQGRAPEDSLSGTGGTAPAPGRRPTSPGRGRGDTVRAWTELFRVSALFSVPGDALAGAAAVGRSPGRGTALAIGASLCLYEAGMALNDWADREEDAVDRPHRPIPSGRISPPAALGAAGVLTAAGLTLAARSGRPALTVATALAATVWAYDLHLKHTKAGPAAMATARALDLLLGATATATVTGAVGERGTAMATASAYAGTGPGPGPRATPPTRVGAVPTAALPVGVGAVPTAGATTFPVGVGAVPPIGPATPSLGVGPAADFGPDNVAGASGPALGVVAALAAVLPALPAAVVLGAHTYGVTAVSRHEAQGGSTAVPLAVLATTAALGAAVLATHGGRRIGQPAPVGPGHAGPGHAGPGHAGPGHAGPGHAGPGHAGPGHVSPGLAGPWPAALGHAGLGFSTPGLASRRAAATGPGASALTATGPGEHHPRQAPAPTLQTAYGPAHPHHGTSLLLTAFTGAYLRTAGPPLLRAALNPSPPLTQRAVGGGIRAMIPLQAALAARAGAPGSGLAVMALVPLARALARKVSPT
ncbi:UbiA family prenyltransferase [Streptomyces sp. NPDC059452]|uniref:UbiA family prenyltransferase n=1 Tax=Streptomyces sp. NPDC059452 TaxID=3346835 RepID=UPI00369D8824